MPFILVPNEGTIDFATLALDAAVEPCGHWAGVTSYDF